MDAEPAGGGSELLESSSRPCLADLRRGGYRKPEGGSYQSVGTACSELERARLAVGGAAQSDDGLLPPAQTLERCCQLVPTRNELARGGSDKTLERRTIGRRCRDRWVVHGGDHRPAERAQESGHSVVRRDGLATLQGVVGRFLVEAPAFEVEAVLDQHETVRTAPRLTGQPGQQTLLLLEQ